MNDKEIKVTDVIINDCISIPDGFVTVSHNTEVVFIDIEGFDDFDINSILGDESWAYISFKIDVFTFKASYFHNINSTTNSFKSTKMVRISNYLITEAEL